MAFSNEITIVLTIFLIAGIFYISRAAFFFIKSTHNVARGKELQMQVNPFSILLSSNFNEEGNRYRNKFFKHFFLALLCLAVCFLIGIIFS